ncbi:hypothetical protein [Sneathiella glossodoripedis]|uniref:hypothetical protein n=1 Tax=Sneathiella glossodoripedis TaxID=418853 RepID=UPI000472D5DA|nr:hypothetical protein [Sneathiella glossodoripedis]
MMIEASTVELIKLLSGGALLLSASYAAFFLARSYYRLRRAAQGIDPMVHRRGAMTDRKLSTLLPFRVFLLSASGLALGLLALILETADFFCPAFIQ